MTIQGNDPITREKREAQADVQSEIRQQQSQVQAQFRAPDEQLLGGENAGFLQRIWRLFSRR